MYFLLKKNSLGVLNICSEGICRFVQDFLKQQNLKSVTCRSFYIPSRREKGLLVLNSKDSETEKVISELMDVIGINASFIYAYDGVPEIDFAYKVYLSMRSPWFWCSLVAVVALSVFIGLAGLFWLSFWGSIGWFASKFIMYLRSLSWRSSIGKN
jgi:hypothetical protein